MSDIYRELIIDHYKNPQNAGVPAVYSHKGEAKNLSCGDECTVYLEIEEGGKVKSLHHDSRGCAISVASASILSEVLEGKTDEEIKTMTEKDVCKLLGGELSPSRTKCALLPLEAVKAAL